MKLRTTANERALVRPRLEHRDTASILAAGWATKLIDDLEAAIAEIARLEAQGPRITEWICMTCRIVWTWEEATSVSRHLLTCPKCKADVCQPKEVGLLRERVTSLEGLARVVAEV